MTAKIIPFDDKKPEPKCSFCKTPKSKTRNMAGNADNGAFICDKCIAKCKELVKDSGD